jgi:hypothetical protein
MWPQQQHQTYKKKEEKENTKPEFWLVPKIYGFVLMTEVTVFIMKP